MATFFHVDEQQEEKLERGIEVEESRPFLNQLNIDNPMLALSP